MPLNLPEPLLVEDKGSFYVLLGSKKLKKGLKKSFKTRGEAQAVADNYIIEYRNKNGI